MRCTPRFLSLNAVLSALFLLVTLAAYSQDALVPGTSSAIVSNVSSSTEVCALDGEAICVLPSAAIPANNGEDSSIQPSEKKAQDAKPPDFNRDIYYRNKREFALDGGWLPINIPFPFDIFESDSYTTYPLKYTLVPIIASLRWHLGGPGGPWILRGNWDATFSGSATAIPKGPETRYFSYDMGIRRNFIPRNSRIAPYVDMRVGLGDIDAKGYKVRYGQGQDFTFTLNMGSGVRYNFNQRYAISAGLNWMHISNMDLSEHKYDPAQQYPWGVQNFGINVYGPMIGLDIRLGRPRYSVE